MALNLHRINLKKDKIDLHIRSQYAFALWLSYPRETHLWQFSTDTLERLLSNKVLKVVRHNTNHSSENCWLIVSNFEARHILNILRTRGALPRHIDAVEIEGHAKEIDALAAQELKLLFMHNVTKRNASRAFKLFLTFPSDVQKELIGYIKPGEPNNDMRSSFAAHFGVRKRQLKAPRKLAHVGDSNILHYIRHPRK